ncbi:MAG: hypothetical protein KKA41_17290 [Proteobacteria bacterium]|nr:hypothetical protein [Pseudomonadota bacterium]
MITTEGFWFLRKKVNKVKLRNCGAIKKADIEFKSGLNIIKGKGATGKSTVIKYLKSKYDKLSHSEQIMMMLDGFLGLHESLLIDDVLGGMDKKNLSKTLIKLSTFKQQIILTLVEMPQEFLSKIKNSKVKCNVIDTRDFKLR